MRLAPAFDSSGEELPGCTDFLNTHLTSGKRGFGEIQTEVAFAMAEVSEVMRSPAGRSAAPLDRGA